DGSGENNVPMGLTQAGFLTGGANGSWSSFTAPGAVGSGSCTYQVSCSNSDGNPGDVEVNTSGFNLPSGGQFAVTFVSYEDNGGDPDYNDSLVIITPQNPSSQLSQQVIQAINQFVGTTKNLGVACGYVQGGVAQFCYAGQLVPYTNQGEQGCPPAMTTPFEIGSVTKVFTATVYQALLAQEVVSVSDTLSKWITNENLNATIGALTLGDLATYSSGLPQDNSNATDLPSGQNYPYEVSAMYDFLETFDPDLGKAGCYAYSNLGWALLAQALVNAAGQDNPAVTDLSSLFATYAFPTGTSAATHFYTTADNQTLPAGVPDESGASPPPSNSTWPAYWGSGGLISTAGDMMLFLQSWMALMAENNPMFQPSGVWKTKDKSAVGLGWFLGTTDNGTQVTNAMKNGGVPSFHSWVGLTPTEGVFILSNSNQQVDSLGAGILRILMGTPGSAAAVDGED
ncbi:beta-lactamase family protein, partial [bacterium]|nr:beta-lactamase family protein [bacterium]